jgi:hypothetical protein
VGGKHALGATLQHCFCAALPCRPVVPRPGISRATAKGGCNSQEQGCHSRGGGDAHAGTSRGDATAGMAVASVHRCHLEESRGGWSSEVRRYLRQAHNEVFWKQSTRRVWPRRRESLDRKLACLAAARSRAWLKCS